jgi:hypothetical protein
MRREKQEKKREQKRQDEPRRARQRCGGSAHPPVALRLPANVLFVVPPSLSQGGGMKYILLDDLGSLQRVGGQRGDEKKKKKKKKKKKTKRQRRWGENIAAVARDACADRGRHMQGGYVRVAGCQNGRPALIFV